jgi:hypothetical protein
MKTKIMTSKERVLTALSHQEPDRIPINYVGANGQIDKRLKEHFGLALDDNEGLMKALNVDFRVLDLPYTGKRLHPEVEGVQVDLLWGIHSRWVENESGGYQDFCDFPLRTATLEEVENWPMPSPDDFDYDSIVEQCERYEEYCIVFGNPGFGDIINSSGMLRTMEQVLIDLITDEPAGVRLFQRKVEIQSEILERVLDKAGKKINLIWTGEDLGTQKSPMISLDIFRKHIRPNHQKFVDIAATYDLPVMIHSCGSSSWAFADFIEMGIRVVDTLQPEAVNMAPAYLKEKYGDKLVFNGSISTAGPMAYGTVDETVGNVKATLDVMKPGGGYFMSPTHLLQDNSPTENVIAAYKTALECGIY